MQLPTISAAKASLEAVEETLTVVLVAIRRRSVSIAAINPNAAERVDVSRMPADRTSQAFHVKSVEADSMILPKSRTATFVVLLIIANVALLAWRLSGNGRTPVPLSSPRKEALVEKWVLADTESFQSVDYSKLVVPESQSECLILPEQAVVISPDAMEPKVLERFLETIEGLNDAYVEGTTAGLVEFMATLGERPSPKFIDAFKVTLSGQPGADKKAIERFSADQTLKAYCGEKLHSNWSSVAPGESCIRFWRLNRKYDSEMSRRFGREFFGELSNVRKFVHVFEPRHKLSNEMNVRGEVMMADVKLLIRFSEDLAGLPCPHFVRMWYCQSDENWHPLEMARNEVDLKLSMNSFLLF